MTAVDDEAVTRVFRAEHGRCVATLVRLTGDLGDAEDAVQEAFAIALDRWPHDGVPHDPGAWITTTARRRAIDRHRRRRRGTDLEQVVAAGHRAAGHRAAGERPAGAGEVGPVDDDELRLLFMCCHPALSLQARVALTLRLFGGLTTAEVARAFLTSEPAMAARIGRAKAKIRDAVVPFRVPDPDDLPDRLDGVLAVVYLLHTTGADRPAGDPHGDALCHEARRLARLLVRLLPDEGETAGLLGLVLLSGARRPARHDADGRLVLLADQDRGRWDADLVGEGLAVVDSCLVGDRLGPYQVQAAIQAVHCRATDLGTTDWDEVLGWYDRLLEVQPSPVVALNRAVALAEVTGPATALAAVEELDLGDYAPYHAVRGELLDRLGRTHAAGRAFDRAARATPLPAAAAHLRERAASLGVPT